MGHHCRRSIIVRYVVGEKISRKTRPVNSRNGFQFGGCSVVAARRQWMSAGQSLYSSKDAGGCGGMRAEKGRVWKKLVDLADEVE